jgi:signal transduction histidine kinase
MAAADLEISSLQQNTLKQQEYEKKVFSNIIVFKDAGNVTRQVIGYKHLADYYETIKRYDKALEYTNRYHSLNDSIQNHEIQTQFKKIEEQYNRDKNEKQISLLQKDQLINKQQLQQQRYLILISLFIILITFGGIWLLANRNKLKQKMKELELRNNIAADLHDEVGSSLSSIHMLSQMAVQNKESAREDILTRVTTNAYETMEKMNDIVWMIKPAADDGMGLKEKMQRFIYDVCNSKNMECSFKADELDGLKLSMSQKKNLYLIFKETVNNAVKYSGSDQLEVLINVQNKNVVMQIKDYGKGFDEKNIIKGNGLDNIQIRAKELNGKLKISSLAHQGTEIDLTFPLN